MASRESLGCDWKKASQLNNYRQVYLHITTKTKIVNCHIRRRKSDSSIFQILNMPVPLIFPGWFYWQVPLNKSLSIAVVINMFRLPDCLTGENQGYNHLMLFHTWQPLYCYFIKMYALLSLRAVRLFAAQALCGSTTRTFWCAALFGMGLHYF